MKSYNFKNIDKIFAIGGMHGNYKEIFDSLKGFLIVKPEDAAPTHPKELERTLRRNKGMYANLEDAKKDLARKLKKMSSSMSNPANRVVKGSLIVALGDNGFGTAPEAKIIKFLTDKNKILAYNNINVVFIRGNNDDPSYFDGEKINFSNIKAVPDYSVLETKNKNILCVGGAISADRTWKKEQEKRVSKKLFWESEAPVFNPELIKEAVEKFKHIDYVLSHSAPSFLNVGVDMSNIKDWEEKDKDLQKDIDNERTCMDKVFECLRDNGSKPLFWGFGHFRNELTEKRSNTIFVSFINPGIHRTIDDEINFVAISEMTSKMMSKKGKSLKSNTITISADLERRLNELNQNQGIAFNDPQPFNGPQPVDAGNPFDRNLDGFFEVALDDENHEDEVALNEENHEDDEFVEDNMEVDEEARPQDDGLELGNLAEPMIEDEPVVEVGEPGENRPAVEEREEIRPATLDEMRRRLLMGRNRPIRVVRNDVVTNTLVADRGNRLYGNHIPYDGTNVNITYFTGANPVQATTAQVANATTIANATAEGRDNG